MSSATVPDDPVDSCVNLFDPIFLFFLVFSYVAITYNYFAHVAASSMVINGHKLGRA